MCPFKIVVFFFFFLIRFESDVPSMELLHKEINNLEDCMKKLKTPLSISFCHNDLLIENFIHDEYESK